MAQPNQLVGIIELDAEPHLDATSDEDITQTLRRLRSVVPDESEAGPDCMAVYSYGPTWNGVDDTMSDSVVVLKADLLQLHCDLESELARLLDKLLASLS